jgi:hypothetical protein
MSSMEIAVNPVWRHGYTDENFLPDLRKIFFTKTLGYYTIGGRMARGKSQERRVSLSCSGKTSMNFMFL